MRASAGVSFYVVIAMQPRYAGEARQVILAAMASNIRPKWTIIVDPDIDVHSSTEVEWAMAFRVQPQRDVIVIENTPAGPSDPSIDDPTKPGKFTPDEWTTMQTHTTIGARILSGRLTGIQSPLIMTNRKRLPVLAD